MEWLESDVNTWDRTKDKGCFYVKIPGQDGRWVSSRQDNRKDAIRWALTQARGEMINSPKLKDFAKDIFLPGKCLLVASREADRDGARTAKHWRDMRQVVVDYLFPKWGAWPMESIPPDKFTEWLLELKSVRRNTLLSGRMRKRIRDAAIEIWNHAVFRRALMYNALLSVPKVGATAEKRNKFSHAEREAMLPENLGTVWRHGENMMCAVSPAWGIASLMAAEGLRPQEVLALYWEDYDFERKGFIVRRAINEEGEKGLKTSAHGVRQRAVRVSDRLAKLLEVGRGHKGPIFLQLNGEFQTVGTFGKVFCKALDGFLVKDRGKPLLGPDGLPRLNKKGVPAINRRGTPILDAEGNRIPVLDRQGRTLYCLRHSKNTELVTVALEGVRQTMGHKTAGMTDYYDDADVQDLWRRAGLA
jgi:integrase